MTRWETQALNELETVAEGRKVLKDGSAQHNVSTSAGSMNKVGEEMGGRGRLKRRIEPRATDRATAGENGLWADAFNCLYFHYISPDQFPALSATYVQLCASACPCPGQMTSVGRSNVKSALSRLSQEQKKPSMFLGTIQHLPRHLG